MSLVAAVGCIIIVFFVGFFFFTERNAPYHRYLSSSLPPELDPLPLSVSLELDAAAALLDWAVLGLCARAYSLSESGLVNPRIGVRVLGRARRIQRLSCMRIREGTSIPERMVGIVEQALRSCAC